MTIPMQEFDRRFVEGFAQLLDGAGVGIRWLAPDAGAYDPSDTGIGLGAFPTLTDRAVALSTYALTDDPVYGDSTVGLQVLTRSAGTDPRDVWALDNAISDALLGRWDFDLPTGIHIVQLTPGPRTELPRDQSQRWIRTASYVCLTFRATSHRL